MTARSRSSRVRRSHTRARPAAPWEEVLVSFTDAVVVMDHQGRVVLFNQAAEELTGRPQARVLNQPCNRVFAQTPMLGEMVSRVQQHGQSECQGEEYLVREGHKIPVRITCLPLWDDLDRVHGTVLVIHDLSYQRKLEESVRRHENLARLGTLVAGLAHEVKNPLAGIKGAAQLLEHRLADKPELAEYTAVITREANRLSGLVEDLLVFGAPPKPHLVSVNIHQVIQHVLSLTAEELTRREIQLRCEFDPSLPNVEADAAQLSQVILNVVNNAMDAMTVPGPARAPRNTMTISTRMETDFHILRGGDRSGKFLRVEIADQGVGIAVADAARVFEPFFTTKPRGTGLGLAISQRIVDEHGGVIGAVANRPRGTVVTVTLPVAAD